MHQLTYLEKLRLWLFARNDAADPTVCRSRMTLLQEETVFSGMAAMKNRIVLYPYYTQDLCRLLRPGSFESAAASMEAQAAELDEAVRQSYETEEEQAKVLQQHMVQAMEGTDAPQMRVLFEGRLAQLHRRCAADRKKLAAAAVGLRRERVLLIRRQLARQELCAHRQRLLLAYYRMAAARFGCQVELPPVTVPGEQQLQAMLAGERLPAADDKKPLPVIGFRGSAVPACQMKEARPGE